MCIVPVPFDPAPVFGKVRAAVKVTLNGYTYRSTIAAMGGPLCIPLRKSNREACVSLQVESADDYYQEWRERVAIRRPPRNESWGARTFDVIDPFGNTIFVIGPMA